MHPKLVALEKSFKQSPLIQISSPLLKEKRIKLWVKRDDLLHSVISGNKWRKLKYILDQVLNQKKHTLISMGGAYSNHLHALAYAAKQCQLKSIGYIRGERPAILNSTLNDLQNWDMELKFVSRSEYRDLRMYRGCDDLPQIQKGEYWSPEGGSSELALKGVGEMVSEINRQFDAICVPCGTGTTLAGIIEATSDQVEVIGFSALKGAGFLADDVKKLLTGNPENRVHWEIKLDYHFGGFAKKTSELTEFMEQFEKQYNIGLDPIYTGKMFFGLFDLIQQDYFKPDQKILAIHTGGLQGKRG